MKVKLIRDITDDGRKLILEKGKEYLVLGIEANDYRIMSDKHDEKPYLYDKNCFEITDPVEPKFWVCSVEEGLRYCYPGEWIEAGFFEDIHNEIEDAQISFRASLKRYYKIKL